jgi:HPt (histidine-containing phosphotransfer) domain-containing protein
VSDASSEPPVVNTVELMARLGGSVAVLAQLLPVFAQSAGQWQAEFDAALAAGDAERLRRAAHQAKGALMTFAAPRAVSAAQALEELARTGRLEAAPAAVSALRNEVELAQAAVAALLNP